MRSIIRLLIQLAVQGQSRCLGTSHRGEAGWWEDSLYKLAEADGSRTLLPNKIIIDIVCFNGNMTIHCRQMCLTQKRVYFALHMLMHKVLVHAGPTPPGHILIRMENTLQGKLRHTLSGTVAVLTTLWHALV